MSRISCTASSVLGPILALAWSGCVGGDDTVQVDDAPMSLSRAEALAYTHLEAHQERFLDGVQAVWTERVVVDRLGMAHTRLVQTVDNIPVFAGVAIVHTDSIGRFAGMTDGLVRHVDVDTRPRIDDLQAIDLAVSATGGWRRVSGPARADLYVLRREGRDHLAYRVELRHMRPGHEPAQPVLFIDAHTGAEIWRFDNLRHWALQNSDQVIYDMHEQTKFSAATVGDSSDGELLETYDSVRATLKFLAIETGRDSYDGNGAVVHAYGQYGAGYNNAFWDSAEERLVLGGGDGTNFGHFGVVDIVAHEIGHAVADHEAGFIYYGESGAIDESNADITAAAVEDFLGHGWVFDIGEDCWVPTNPLVALRYMSRPSDDGSSRDHYSKRYTGTADNGGVHFNSGIGNHFFYLLVEGGRHHNPDLQSGNTVQGIGMDAAHRIWYRALSVYLVPSSDFVEARLATEKACDDLYSADTCQQVSLAWHEVGVGSAP